MTRVHRDALLLLCGAALGAWLALTASAAWGGGGGADGARRLEKRSAELRTVKRLRDAMDTHGHPRMARLMGRLAEAHSLATADAATILTVWAFAAEHWQQSLQSSRRE